MDFNNLNHFKSVFAAQLFVMPADRNYLLARWCRLNRLPEEFYWNSCQAVEKYLKATILLNGGSVESHGHSISNLYNVHLDCLADNAVINIVKPVDLKSDCWRDEPIGKFINRFNNFGNPNMRYGLTSWHYEKDDIFKFDLLCFKLRQISIGLDWIVGDDFPVDELKDFYGLTFKEVFAANSEIQIRELSLPKEGAAEPMNFSDYWYGWNFPYARNEDDIQRVAPKILAPDIGPARNSYLYLLYRTLEKGNITPVLSEGTRWLIDNIKLDRESKRALEELLAR